MEIDHVAIVVEDLEATVRLYTETLGFKEVYREIIYDQGVEAVGLEAGDSVVELLLPLDESSPIARYRGDAATKLHHTAYRVADIEAKLAELKARGVRLIDEHAAPRRARESHRLSASKGDRRRPHRTLPAASAANTKNV